MNTTHTSTLTLSRSTLGILSLCTLLAVGCTDATMDDSTPPSDDDETRDPLTDLPFTLDVTSTTVPAGGVMPEYTVFSDFGCTGGNISPELSWSPGPEGTQSYMIMMYDPDAPTGVGFHHWWIANLPAATLSLPEGASNDNILPEGAVQGRQDYGGSSYGGPCPPEGRTHRYQFYVWAMAVDQLPLSQDTSPVVARFMLAQNALAVGRLVATYGR
ncbi:MAG: YbhB/YbcL family Raf kinase inhibitor-like protein [Myxococcota bacterium]